MEGGNLYSGERPIPKINIAYVGVLPYIFYIDFVLLLFYCCFIIQ